MPIDVTETETDVEEIRCRLADGSGENVDDPEDESDFGHPISVSDA
jgi:hypothetical protein